MRFRVSRFAPSPSPSPADGGGRCCATTFACAIVLLTSCFVEAQQPEAKSFQEVMAVVEWTPQRFGQFKDDEPLGPSAEAELARLLLRLQAIPTAKLSAWAQGGSDFESLAAAPTDHRGELFHLTGKVVGVSEQRLEVAAAAALEQPNWNVCEIRLDRGETVEVISRTIPEAWSKLSPLDEPVVCDAVFVRRTETGDDRGRLQFVAPHIAWYPTQPDPPTVNFGMATLGSLGVDMAKWPSMKRAGSLTGEDFTAFYQTLAAMRKIDAGRLIKLARSNLEGYAQPYRDELAKLDDVTARATRRGAILREIVTTADEGRFSVWPLFLEASDQRGQLVVFTGVVRRAVRVDTSIDRDGAASDALNRFGIDHYYELEMFTEDSQNKPLVFCVLELPAGFPTGDDLHESVRMAGFLFKIWSYRGRRPTDESPATSAAAHDAREAAPLLIGRGPLRIETSAANSSSWAKGVMGSLLALAIGSLWFAVWWFRRGDKHFEKTTLAKLQSPREPLRIEVPEIRENDE